MRILLLIQKAQLRGAEMFASQLGNHLQQAGHTVWVVSLVPGTATLPFEGEIYCLNRTLKKRFADVAGWRKLAAYIEEIRPDVVQANASDTLKFAVFSKLLTGWKAPLVYRNANKASDFINSYPKLVFNRFLARRATHVISVSEICRQDFIKLYGIPERKTTMIPIGIERVAIPSAPPADLAHVFNGEARVLVNIASLVPEKNHEGLLRIARELLKQGEKVRVVVLGDGKLRPVLEESIRQMGLEGQVQLLGYRRDVPAILAHADAYVLPSLIEGLPGTILEAFYSRVPVIAYNVGGIGEVVQTDHTGWLVEKSNEAGFIVAVRQALHDATHTAAIREEAYQRVIRDFMNEHIAERFARVYTAVCKRIS
ncbi:glycosyltransferase family 4 protein [Fulvivirgaceae bacterium PWU5]|uniref:Glycosyltransferase family 4 protein n=1 Tax=Dawidia cretensis TaxID=2782350 RepID=A0AAP2DXS2_9BACT|nr:glycosyltransferase family 4 protein [Dawidia cretensis]MBT1709595.1 glycosyltransferase family 4 protein [Dawidia cretensis]